MTSLPALGALLGTPVRLRDLRVGTVTGIYADAGFHRVIGLEITGPDGARRFLPWVAGAMDDGIVRIQSPFVLVETGELDGYIRLGARVARAPAELDGLGVGLDGRVEPVPGGVLVGAAAGTPVG